MDTDICKRNGRGGARSGAKRGQKMPLDVAEKQADKAPEAQPKRGGKTRLLTISDLDGRTRAAQHAEETRNAIVADLRGRGPTFHT